MNETDSKVLDMITAEQRVIRRRRRLATVAGSILGLALAISTAVLSLSVGSLVQLNDESRERGSCSAVFSNAITSATQESRIAFNAIIIDFMTQVGDEGPVNVDDLLALTPALADADEEARRLVAWRSDWIESGRPVPCPITEDGSPSTDPELEETS